MNLDSQTYQDLSQKIIGIGFKDVNLLKTAFTHCSYLNEHKRSSLENNERLEFLGDAVLEIIVTDYLYRNYQHPEGILTNWRASLVRTESLASVARKLHFLDYLRVSKGERKSSQRAQEQILANVFEAVIGAIYLDQGYQAADNFIQEYIISLLPAILEEGTWIDAKTRFQEHIQMTQNQTPIYRILNEDGPDHNKTFLVGVYVEDKLCGKGQGYSKQAAAQKAAQVALDKLNIKPVSL
ncbi:MAG: ribonuclease III [Candidatus Saccharibacteria bacterium]|nr:ribonuclease III [Candidatus Saccharibacteria bacterium]MCY4010511.1 ribonuclease III [Candidatus Saccharibacteria bacterium]